MDIGDFMGIAVVGGLLSLVIQAIKTKFGTDSGTTKFITIALAVLVGGVYFLLRDTVIWQTILGILGAASAVYAFFLK